MCIAILVLSVLAAGTACQHRGAEAPVAGRCALPEAWVQQTLDLWDRSSTQLLGRREPLPYIVYFDAACAYHLGRRPPGEHVDQRPLQFRGARLAVWGVPHAGTVTLPGNRTIDAGVYAAASHDGVEPFYAMALPSLWYARLPRGEHGDHLAEELLTLAQHELTHTLQMPAFRAFATTLDVPATYVINDNAIQHVFGDHADYVAAYQHERDLLIAALHARELPAKRRLARRALDRARGRHARFFRGPHALLARLDGRFVAAEGLGEWVRYKLMIEGPIGLLPQQAPEAARALLRGGEPFWSQEQGLLIVLLLEELMPAFQQRLLGAELPDAFALLDEATRT